jgi:glycosyltransferase involved in cell wall biosynthesis
MRLLYVGNPNTIHVQRWVRYFVNAGHDVHLVVVNQVRVPPDRLAGVTVHDVSLHYKPTRLAHLLEVPRMRRVIAETRPDIVHAHYVARYGWLAALAGFKPLVLTAWGGDVLPRQGALDTSLARLLTPFTLRQATAITVDAPDVAEICRRASGSARIETITFGADLNRFRPGLPVDDMRRCLDIPAGARVVLSPRIFAPIYNIDTIIASLPAVVQRHPDVIYVLQNYSSLGNAEYGAALTHLVDRLKMRDHVRFAGELAHEDMAVLYNVADVVVSVPTSDGVPATFFESMGCGVPLVVSDLPAYDGLIVHGETGIRVPARDARALSDALIALLDDPACGRRLAEAAGAVVREKGDFNREMSRVDALYRELTER